MIIKKYALLLALLLSLLSGLLGACGSAVTPGGTTSLPFITKPAAAANLPIIRTFDLTIAQADAQNAAEDFIRHSSTFIFDGIAGSLDLARSDPGMISAYMSWSFTFKFETLHPGHGNRTGQSLPELITAHYATVLVNLVNNTVVMAACDNTWDMLKERDLSVYISGIVIGGGDTTPPDGSLDVPRFFVYKVMRDEGLVNVSFIAYPPSPAGDAARARITLDFYSGSIRVGDRIEAYGNLDRQTNTLMVANDGDYIKTYVVKATVLGIIVSIQKITPAAGSGNTSEQYLYELLRDDSTFISVSYTNKGAALLSLYNEAIQIGEYMKAVGIYDKSTNTIAVTAADDLLKTYDHNPVRAEAVWE
jgi:hypothetical protein